MTTWAEIFPGAQHPVRGSLSEFSGARDAFENMRADGQNVVDQFQNFSDPGFVDGHLNNEPGALVTKLLSDADDGLRDLPRVANEARGIFSDHYTALEGLHERADSALARAKTAWDRKNELLEQRSSLSSQITGLNSDIDNAAPDADTTTLDGDLSGAQSSLSGVNGELESVQNTLDGIYGNDDSEWNEIRNDEHSRDETSIGLLNDINLGNLEDPGFWDKVGEFFAAIGDFLGGILESLANLVEAFVTGDWATVLWELKNLFEAALLIIGTIALFTGVGTVLGAILIGLAVASFAVNLALWKTQIPNPQTGETVSGIDVVIAGVGVLFAGVSVLQTVRTVTAFNQAAGGLASRGATHTFGSVFRAQNAVGFRNGALPQFFMNAGGNVRNGVNMFYNRFRPSISGGSFPVTPAWRAQPGVVPILPAPINAGVPASWETVTTALPTPGSEPTIAGRYAEKATAGGFDGFNVANPPGGGSGTPVFGPANRFQALKVAQQVRQSPDVQIIPATP